MSFGNWIMIWTAAMPLAVLIYYFFRKKYTVQQVPSTLFWQELMKEWQASPYLKKLQQHLLFYLQMAALLLFVFLLLEPYVEKPSLAGDEWIFVVDASASMLAGEPSRLEVQKDEMKQLLESGDGRPVTIVIAGASPKVELRRERDKGALMKTIEDITVEYESAEMEQTLSFADTLTDSDATIIHIFTDSLDRAVLANRTSGAYEVHGFKEQPANVSIRQFGVTERDGSMSAIVQVINDSEAAMPVTIEVTDGTVTESKEIELASSEEQLVVFDSLPLSILWIATVDAEDDYKTDNEMAAYLQQSANRVMIDAELHQLVSAGFDSLGANVQLVPGDQLDAAAGFPVVTNRISLLEGKEPMLLIGRDDAEAVEAKGAVTAGDHPLFAYADLADVYVAELYPPIEGYETIATVGEAPWIQVGPNGNIVILSDIQSTDWPLSPSFPLFLWSTLNELSGDNEFAGMFRPNEIRSISIAGSGTEWDLYRGEEFISTYKEGEGAFTAPAAPGVYKLIGEEQSMNLIVQLGEEEKQLQAGSSYRIGQGGEVGSELVRVSFLPWIIPLILLIVLIEWEVYRRGISRR